MTIDPRELDEQELNRELQEALGDANAPELHGAPARSRGAKAERGRIHGTIVAVRGDDVLIDIGGKAEAFCPTEEFSPDHPPQLGQSMSFVPQGFDRETGQMRLSLKAGKSHVDWDSIRIGDVIEARVTGVNIGGLELDVRGVRGFMPKSQVDINRLEHFTQFVNHKMECEIVEIDRRGKSVLLSRRRVLEKQRESARAEARQTLAEGQVRSGIVRRLADFGAFVDIGGIDGLLHVSDISYARINNPAEVLKVGDEVQVQVLKIDTAKDRISLGMKQLKADPWTLVEANYKPSQTIDGRVTRLADFGAFVELEPGVEGLLPVSEMSWTKRIRHPRELVKEGDSVRAQVMSIDSAQRRISLSLKALGADPWSTVQERYTPQSTVTGMVTRLAPFGAFVQLEEGVEGLAHISELSDKHVRSVGDAVKEGQVVQARILGVDLAQRRISLSLKTPSSAPIEAAPETPGAAPAAPKKEKRRPLRGGLAW
ncbi:MAG: S1 RNA-binding domain-containing protein [Phycisphaerales bacterium]|nr:S1 RNA-binding domain-containing protein [Phycisphaerales bacterium]